MILPYIIVIDLNYYYTLRNSAGWGDSCPLGTCSSMLKFYQSAEDSQSTERYSNDIQGYSVYIHVHVYLISLKQLSLKCSSPKKSKKNAFFYQNASEKLLYLTIICSVALKCLHLIHVQTFLQKDKS